MEKARSDALVHNLPVRHMGRAGLDYESLSRINPGLVMASITPFGLTGPYRHYNAYDINLAAGGGICSGLGEADREPLTFGTPEVGYFAGMAAASSIVMALLARDNVGGGQHIDIAEVESMAGVYNGPEALMAVYQWRVTRRTGHHALDFPYPNCILRCKDGYIFVGAPEGRQWRQLLEVMGSPEWSKDPRFRNRTEMNNRYADELDSYLESWLMQYTKAELLDIALELERIALEDDYFVKRKLYPNVDFYSGLIYQAMGFPVDMFPVLFAIPRTAGWLSQWEEMLQDKDQKIARPRQVYLGATRRPFVPIEARS